MPRTHVNEFADDVRAGAKLYVTPGKGWATISTTDAKGLVSPHTIGLKAASLRELAARLMEIAGELEAGQEDGR